MRIHGEVLQLEQTLGLDGQPRGEARVGLLLPHKVGNLSPHFLLQTTVTIKALHRSMTASSSLPPHAMVPQGSKLQAGNCPDSNEPPTLDVPDGWHSI